MKNPNKNQNLQRISPMKTPAYQSYPQSNHFQVHL